MKILRRAALVAAVLMMALGLLMTSPARAGAQAERPSTPAVHLLAADGAPVPAGGDLAALGGAAGLVTVVVALAKSVYRGAMPPTLTLGLVVLIAALVMGLEVVSHLTAGKSPIDLFASWIGLIVGAVGLREVATGLAPVLSTLPTNAAQPTS